MGYLMLKTSEAIWFVVYENGKLYASVNELIRGIKTVFDSVDSALFTELYNSMINRLRWYQEEGRPFQVLSYFFQKKKTSKFGCF